MFHAFVMKDLTWPPFFLKVEMFILQNYVFSLNKKKRRFWIQSLNPAIESTATVEFFRGSSREIERSCLTPFFSQGRNVQTYVFSLNKEKRGQFGSKHWIRLLNQRRLSNFLGGHRESLKRRASRNTLSVKITLVYLNKKNIDSGRNKELFHLYGKLEKKIASQFLPGPWGTAPASQLSPPYPYWFNYIIYIV
jgi:hypothetical protein